VEALCAEIEALRAEVAAARTDAAEARKRAEQEQEQAGRLLEAHRAALERERVAEERRVEEQARRMAAEHRGAEAVQEQQDAKTALSRCEAQLQAHAPFPDRAPIQRRGAGDGGKTLSSTGAEARATYGLWLVPECGCRRGRRDSQLRRASLAPRSTRAPDRSSVPERRCLLSNHLHTDCCASLYLCCARDFSAVHRLERSGALHMCDLLDLLHDL